VKLNIKKSFTNKKFKNSAYSTVVVVIVVTVILLVNLFVGELDIKVDLSSDAMYTLTEETKEVTDGLEDDVTLYYVVQEGNQIDKVELIVNQYSKLSNKLKVVKKDPILFPTFTSKYIDQEVSENSIIVVNEKTETAKYIPYENMLVTEMNATTYKSELKAIDVEGQISAAIEYVTTDNLPIMYVVEGHGEAKLGETLTTEINKLNVEMKTISTLSVKEIPEDCQLLLINGPTFDFTEDEMNMVKEYLEAGGDAIVFSSYSLEEMNNFNDLLNYYGVELEEGIIMEESDHYMGNYPNYIISTMESHEIVSEIASSGKPIVVPIAQGITLLDSLRSTLIIDPILTSSQGSYSKVDMESETTAKEAEDINGPFHIGVAITEKYEEVETKLAVYSSPYILDESMVSTGQFGNVELLLNSISWITNVETGLTIPTRSVAQTYLTVSTAQANFWGGLLVIIIPVMLLAAGFVIWIRRRNC
jgi:ABC-2 type transport system permease protein